MPSASTWWNATISAARSPSMPVTTVSRHNGRSDGNRSPILLAASSSTAVSSPGAGQAT